MKKIQLVKSTSGIRGVVGNGLDPVMITAYGAAFGTMLKSGKVVLGRDTRPSGDFVCRAVVSGLLSVGLDVIDIGIVPTPTVEIAVKETGAAGGICVTASHNPAQWNALKFFNATGEFITPAQYKRLDKVFQSGRFACKPVTGLGKMSSEDRWVEVHLKRTLALRTLNKKGIRQAGFKVVVDAINGAGHEALPVLLERLGCKVVRINCKSDGDFVHEPEPTPKNLSQLCRAVKKHQADLGMACDPDADRLALVNDKGEAISEELTLAIAVFEVLRRKRGPTVINLSTSRVTADVAKMFGSRVYYSKVGEANVIQTMRTRKAVIGGEGNGGVIYPEFHAGRDCLVAAALVLSALASQSQKLSALVGTFPRYANIKGKSALPANFDKLLARFEKESARRFGKSRIDRRDGLRFDFDQGWLQLRKSNTEPIFRLIVETTDQRLTDRLYRETIRFFK